MKRMRVELFPDFEEVFIDNTLKGVFYPLCKVIVEGFHQPLYIVSSNGLWFDTEVHNDYNSEAFTLFKVENDKYHFLGDVSLYQGVAEAHNIFPILEKDFEKNKSEYVSLNFEEYRKKVVRLFEVKDKGFDIDYYLETFYHFSVNRLEYQTTGKMKSFSGLEDISSFEDVEANEEFFFPKEIALKNYQLIGSVIGNEFFSEGNDVTLLYNETENKALIVNSYS